MAVSNFEVNKSDLKSSSNKKTSKPKKKGSTVLLVEQELKFAKLLAGNDKKIRDKVLKNLRKWLGYRSQSSFSFDEEDFMRLWKGLFYCMWMSDKPLVQEDLAENISNLIHCFSDSKDAILFFKCFLKTMSREWFGIDIHRLNKFLMFVRRMLRQCFVVLSHNQWKCEILEQFGEAILSSVLKQNNALGLTLHLSEIFLEELAKVSEGKLNPELVAPLLKPFALYLAESDDKHASHQLSYNVFLTLLHQSDAGMEYQEKFNAWRKQGFPGGNIDCMQKVEVSDDETEDVTEEHLLNGKNEDDIFLEEHLNHIDNKDPRAGHVDVVLPQIQFHAPSIASMLDSFMFGTNTNVQSRKLLRTLVERYNKFAKGEFPLGIKKIAVPTEEDLKKTNITKAAKDLIKFEQKLFSDSAKNKKKKRKLKKKQIVQNNVTHEDENVEKENTKLNENFSVEPVSNRKRKSMEPVLKEVQIGKKIKKRSSSEWKVEDVDNTYESPDVSITPSENGSVAEVQTETVVANIVSPVNGRIGPLKRKNTNPEKAAKKKNSIQILDEWNQPLQEGEEEFFVPSRKHVLKAANMSLKNEQDTGETTVITPKTSPVKSTTEKKRTPKKNSLLLNPFALPSPKVKSPKNKLKTSTPNLKKDTLCKTPVNSKSSLNKSANSSEKRVKIVLKHNISQNTDEYIEQIRSSPQIPFDAGKKPSKTLLKPSVAPSRINPYYKFQEERQKKK